MEYHIIHQIRCGILDHRLQQELLQKHSTLATLNDIMKYCETYESAKSDSKKLSETPVVASASAEHEEMVTSAISTYKVPKTTKWIIQPPRNVAAVAIMNMININALLKGRSVMHVENQTIFNRYVVLSMLAMQPSYLISLI